MRKLLVLSSALVMLFVSSSGAVAQPPENFGAHLTGSEEVPANNTPAQGQATFKLVSPHTMTYRLIASNIDNVVAAHIHCGPVGQNGPPVQFLFGPAGPEGRHDGVLATGEFDPSFDLPDDGTCAGMTLADAMTHGLTYVNVHTNDGGEVRNVPGDIPGGEIRGQIRLNG